MLRPGAMIAAMMALTIAAMAGGIKDYAAYKLQYFSDNNDVQVLTNSLTLNKGLGGHFTASGSILVDAITAASKRDIRGKGLVDAVTSASLASSEEQRRQGSGTIAITGDVFGPLFGRSGNPSTVDVTGIYSTESDYLSKTIAVSAKQDLFKRNTTVGFSVSESWSRFMPIARFIPKSDAGWDWFGNGKRLTDRVSVSLAQTVTPRTLVSLIGEYGHDQGYLARPYQVYRIMADDSTALFYHESAPPNRKSAAFSAHVNQYLPVGRGASVQCDYRWYRDSWDIQSHTMYLRFYYRLMRSIVVNPSYRFYTQRAAFFYRDIYTAIPSYLTTDFILGRYHTNTLGLKLIYEHDNFIKPVESSFFALFPVSFDIAVNYMLRSSTNDPDVRNSHYSYWPTSEGYRNIWMQCGIKIAY